MKTKKFDCVEMKNQIQAKLMEEYEANKDKYGSYVDFIHKTAEASPWIQAMEKRITEAKLKKSA
jgi:hypothetical protein